MAYASHYTAAHLKDEREIVDRLIVCALERNYLVSLHDGEERVLSRSSSYDDITANIAATDMTILTFFDPSIVGPAGKGRVILIHGNGEDVVHDYTDNDLTGDLVAHATGEDFRV